MRHHLSFLSVVFLLTINHASAQEGNKSLDDLKNQIGLWNSSFNSRDTNLYFKLIDDKIVVTAGGGTEIGASEFKETTNNLFSDRVGITMFMNAEIVEIGDWNIGYDSGNWIESWKEKNSTLTSEIKGKYYRMWKKGESNWVVMSIILTPLTFRNY